MFNKMIDNYILSKDYFTSIEDKINDVSDIISNVILEEGRIIFVCVGTSADITRGIARDLEFNFGLTNDKVMIKEAGLQHSDHMLNWKEVGASQSMAVFELMDIDLNKDDVIIALSSSGETEYIIGALNYSRDIGCKNILITNSTKCNDLSENIISIPFNQQATNVRSLEATTLMKMILDIIIYGSVNKAGRTLNGQLIYQKWNSERTKKSVVEAIANATGKEDGEVIGALDSADWVSEIATVMLLDDLDAEEAKGRLRRLKGSFKNWE